MVSKLSDETRRQILSLADKKEKYKVIAKTYGVSVSCVKSIVSRYRKCGSLTPKPRNVKRVTDGQIGNLIKKFVTDNPRIPYRQLPDELAKSVASGTRIPAAATCLAFLKENGYHYNNPTISVLDKTDIQ